MSDKKNSEQSPKEIARRKTLHMLCAGGAIMALPETWKKPAVNAVALPVHAGMTPPMTNE